MEETKNIKVQFSFAKENSSFVPEESGINGEIFVNPYIGKVYLGKKLIATNVGQRTSEGEVFNDYLNNVALGTNSHAEGHYTRAVGIASHAEGIGTITNNEGEHASGKYNNSSENTLFSVGNGTPEQRNNAFEVTKDGNTIVEKIIESQGFVIKGGEGKKVLLDDGSLKDLSDFSQKQNIVTKQLDIVMSEQGYENGEEVSSLKVDEITINFIKGESSTTPKYYETGESIRLYAQNQMNISGVVINKVVFEFGSSDGENEISVDSGSLTGNVWTGSENNITFTIEGSKGNRRIKKMSILYEIEQLGPGSDTALILKKLEEMNTAIMTMQTSIQTINTNVDKISTRVEDIEQGEIIWEDTY